MGIKVVTTDSMIRVQIDNIVTNINFMSIRQLVKE